MPLKNTGVLDIDGWSPGRKKSSCPRHSSSPTITSKGSSKDFCLNFSALLRTRKLLMMARNNIEYHIISISTYIHNSFYYNATHSHEDIRNGSSSPSTAHWLPPSSSHFLYSLASAYLYSSSATRNWPEKESICPIEQSTSLLSKISSWRNSMQLLLFPSIFLSAHITTIFFQEICPIPF